MARITSGRCANTRLADSKRGRPIRAFDAGRIEGCVTRQRRGHAFSLGQWPGQLHKGGQQGNSGAAMVIVIEHRRRFSCVLGTTIMVSAIGVSMMLMLVMPKVLRLTLSIFVQAIRLHRRPNGLERQQYQQENGDQSTHGYQYIGTQNKI
jgi:hypothetical protein